MSRGATMLAAAVICVSSIWSGAPAPAAVGSPIAEIMNPENSKVFRPGDVALVDGNAFAGLGVHAVKLEFWLLNRLERAVLAGCGACKTGTAAYWKYDASGLIPGYYVVKAYAVDNAGNFSPPASRGFVYGLQQAPTVTPPAPPQVPGGPKLPVPPTIVPQVPGTALPGAGGPVKIGGGTGEPNQNVRIRETSLGPIGSVRSDDDGTWQMTTRLPSGTYRFRARAIDDAGRPSRWSKITVIQVDSDRPLLDVIGEDERVFLPTDPVVIEGTLFDERAPAAIRLEYWLADEVVLVDLADCIACGQQQTVWQHRPQGLAPGYYHVRITAWDQAGNAAHQAQTTFITTSP